MNCSELQKNFTSFFIFTKTNVENTDGQRLQCVRWDVWFHDFDGMLHIKCCCVETFVVDGVYICSTNALEQELMEFST